MRSAFHLSGPTTSPAATTSSLLSVSDTAIGRFASGVLLCWTSCLASPGSSFRVDRKTPMLMQSRFRYTQRESLLRRIMSLCSPCRACRPARVPRRIRNQGVRHRVSLPLDSQRPLPRLTSLIFSDRPVPVQLVWTLNRVQSWGSDDLVLLGAPSVWYKIRRIHDTTYYGTLVSRT
jgi:hypothetical protein